MKELIIHTEYIELKCALKLLNVISTGGCAKPFLEENEVLINGVKEERRGRKLYEGDVIKVLGEEIIVKNEH